MLTLSGCSYVFKQPLAKDFSGIPYHRYFIEAYSEDENNQLDQTLDNYMIWVDRFYNGWVVYDMGWLETTEKVLNKIEDSAEKALVAEKMQIVGKQVCAEWAKDNKHDVISTRTLSNLGESLKEASSRKQVLWFLDEVLKDLAKLKNRELQQDDIQVERYFPDLTSDKDWHNFF